MTKTTAIITKNTNENKKKKKSVTESAAITNDFELVHILLQQTVSYVRDGKWYYWRHFIKIWKMKIE